MNNSDVRINRALLQWILLGIGLIGLIVMVVALLATPGATLGDRFNTTSFAALGVAILGIAGFVFIDPQPLVEAVTGRTGVYTITSWVISLFFVAVVVLLYIIVDESSIQPIELGKESEYRVSEETTDLLAGLEQPVHATAFIPTGSVDQREDAEIWLKKYESLSDGKFTYSFVDPDRNPSEAARLGVTRSGVIVLEQGDNTAEASFADERNLTMALVQVGLGEPRKAYYITGHGERDMDNMSSLDGFAQAINTLERTNLTIEKLNLFTSPTIPDDADLIILAGPQSLLSEPEVEAIDAYLQSGGKMLAMIDTGAGRSLFGAGVQSVAFSPRGNRIATAGTDRTAKLWDALDENPALQVFRGHNSDVLDIAFNPDGGEVTTVGADGTVRVWDTNTGEELHLLVGQTALANALTYTSNGDYLVSVGQDQVINIWDTSTYELMPFAPIPSTTALLTVAPAPRGSTFAVSGARQTGSGGLESFIYVYDAKTGEELVNQSLHTAGIFGLAFSEDGDTIYSTAQDGTLGTLELDDPDGATTESVYPDEGIIAFGLAPDGTRLFGLRSDNTIRVQSPEGEELEVLEGHTDIIRKIAVSPDGDRFASASFDGTVIIWSLEDYSKEMTLTAHSNDDPFLAYLAESWSIVVNDNFVVEPLSPSLGIDRMAPVTLPDPAFYDAQSEITQPLLEEGVYTVFVRARSIDVLESQSIMHTELIFTTAGDPPNASWASSTEPGLETQYNPEIHVPGPFTLAVSAENPLSGSQIIVVGDADFASNELMGAQQFGNAELLTNMANALSDVEINIPPPNFEQRNIELSPPLVTVASIVSVCIIPGLGLVIGAVMWYLRRRRR